MMPRGFLARMDELESAIDAAVDKVQRRELTRDRAALSHQFATLMDEQGFTSFTLDDGRIVAPVWSVEGFARHKSDEARDWLMSNGVKWDGTAKMLRREIAQLLQAGALLPAAAFGLHVTRTIQVRDGVPSRRSRTRRRDAQE